VVCSEAGVGSEWWVWWVYMMLVVGRSWRKNRRW